VDSDVYTNISEEYTPLTFIIIMEALCPSEILAPIYQTTRCHKLEDHSKKLCSFGSWTNINSTIGLNILDRYFML
jgi:hypothetical protein